MYSYLWVLVWIFVLLAIISSPTVGVGLIVILILAKLFNIATSEPMRLELPRLECPESLSKSEAHKNYLAQTTGVNESPEEISELQGECKMQRASVDERTPDIPYNLVTSQVLADDPIDHPGTVDRNCEKYWFGSQHPNATKEQQDMSMHRSMRRNHEWNATHTWSPEDKEKFERSRRRLESEIATSLRADPYMIIERTPDADYSATSDHPFAALTSDHHMWHSGQLRATAAFGSGNLANELQTKGF